MEYSRGIVKRNVGRGIDREKTYHQAKEKRLESPARHLQLVGMLLQRIYAAKFVLKQAAKVSKGLRPSEIK